MMAVKIIHESGQGVFLRVPPQARRVVSIINCLLLSIPGEDWSGYTPWQGRDFSAIIIAVFNTNNILGMRITAADGGIFPSAEGVFAIVGGIIFLIVKSKRIS